MIIHRAFTREVLHTCGAVSVILLAIFLVTRLMDFLRQAADGDIPMGSVFLLLLLKTIAYFDLLAPLVLYVSTLLVMGRWIRDNELAVVNACGLGMYQFLKPAATLVAIVGTLAALFALYLTPLSTEISRALLQDLRQHTDAAGVMPGVFVEARDGSSVYFVERYDAQTDTFGNLFIYDGGGREEGVVVAATGDVRMDEKTKDEFLTLKNGSRYRGTAGQAEYAVLDFATYQLRLKSRARGGYTLPVRAMPTLALLDARLDEDGLDTNRRDAIAEFHWRLAKVVMLPILMVFALAFSSITYRKTRFPGMLSALLVYFAYANLLGFGVALIRRGAVHPHLGLWMIHLTFLAFAVYLLRRRNFNQRLLPGLPA